MIEIHIDQVKRKEKSSNLITVMCRFESEIMATVNGRRLNGKSIMNISEIERARKLDIVVKGTDEQYAADAICSYFEETPVQGVSS